MSNLTERVNQRIAALGLNPNSVAKKLGVRQSSIVSLTSGRTRTFRKIHELANVLQTSTQWLLTGQGRENVESSFSREAPPAILQDTVPVLGKALASKYGPAIFIDPNNGDEIGRAPRHPAQEGVATAFAVYAEGDSMFPRYEPGELVYIAGFTPPMRGQDCLIELKSGEAYLKKFVRRTEKEVICLQYYPKEEEWKCPLSEVSQIHAVVGRR